MENKTVTFYGDDFILETWATCDDDAVAIKIAAETLDEQLGWDVLSVANDVRVAPSKYQTISTTPAPIAAS